MSAKKLRAKFGEIPYRKRSTEAIWAEVTGSVKRPKLYGDTLTPAEACEPLFHLLLGAAGFYREKALSALYPFIEGFILITV
ncbi:hypothetical protein NPIL_575801 [Nephila pilipes]|uniref:Uncharacterized protein n=1 Tax=Nephila pilipes TaxID=299642 RepID=A0A8X6UHW4_NEPPI|nr:hypothetical protein NPIL_575801 [Nephila pilipes]